MRGTKHHKERPLMLELTGRLRYYRCQLSTPPPISRPVLTQTHCNQAPRAMKRGSIPHCAVNPRYSQPYCDTKESHKQIKLLYTAVVERNLMKKLYHSFRRASWLEYDLIQCLVLQCVDNERIFSRRYDYRFLSKNRLSVNLVYSRLSSWRQKCLIKQTSQVVRIVVGEYHTSVLGGIDSIWQVGISCRLLGQAELSGKDTRHAR